MIVANFVGVKLEYPAITRKEGLQNFKNTKALALKRRSAQGMQIGILRILRDSVFLR